MDQCSNGKKEKKNLLEQKALNRPEKVESKTEIAHGRILVTGGTGILGKKTAAELKKRGWSVRIPTRKIPPAANCISGVEYFEADLGDSIPSALLEDVETVVHCAAATSGGKEAHIKNSINATQNLLLAMAKNDIKKLIQISSIAVLESSAKTGCPIDENTPIFKNHESRGPYAWGKAESEILAKKLCESLGITLRLIRPGPIVDYNAYKAPGRLGRKIGIVFVMVGNKEDRMNVCKVDTAAKILSSYVEDFDLLPHVLNLLEPNPPTRGELTRILLSERSDLKIVVRIPFPILWIGSFVAKGVQRIIRPKKTLVDLYSAFVSERYNIDLSIEVLRRYCL